MKYLIPAILATLILSGCKTRVEGQLNVTKDISLREFSGNTQSIKVGTYTADLSPNGSEKIALRLNNDNNQRFNFAIPAGSKLPDNGTVVYTAAQVGQAVDVLVSVNTNRYDTQVQEQTTSCTYQMPVQVCYPVPNGGVACSIQYQTVWGYQWQRFYDQITDKHVSLNIMEPGVADASAGFLGNSSTAQRIILGQSPCR
jgi:hypothetical protein